VSASHDARPVTVAGPLADTATGAPVHAHVTRVAAAVVLRGDGHVLLAQRPPGKAYEGYWEFPGGKLEPGETPAHALARELREELGVEVVRAAPWFVQEFVYPHAHVELNFFRVFEWRGELHGHDGQAFAWQVPGAFDVAPLLPANTRVLAALMLPPAYGITCAEDMGEPAFLGRAERALAAGLRLIQVREKRWPADRVSRFAASVRDLARRYGAKVLLNGDADAARALELDGVHWTSAALRGARSRPDDMIVAASCHDRDQIARAGDLGLDFAVLGPVRATPTHPGATTLGLDGLAACLAGARLPVYALGGLVPADLDAVVACGAHGVAMRRHAWP
jgi:8-oxo-dGTP diphosphatase